MFLDNAMERINRLILQGGRNGMTELQFYAAEIREWKNSLKRMDQIKGADYYEGRHDILNRKRTIIGADGKLQEVDNLPNNRLIDNQYALMVDQKTNYLVGKPFTVNCQNKAYPSICTISGNGVGMMFPPMSRKQSTVTSWNWPKVGQTRMKPLWFVSVRWKAACWESPVFWILPTPRSTVKRRTVP